MVPTGRLPATRAGQDPRAGSLAPTPTVSDAPMATYRTVGVADGVSVGVAVGTGVALGARDRCAWLAGVVCAGGVAAGEHAAANELSTDAHRRR